MDVAIYSRISTKNHGQDNINQLRQLRAFCGQQGYRIVDEYVDQASGSRNDRPEFKRLFADAAQRRFSLCLFWSLDRLSREGVLETLRYLEGLTSYGVGWKSYTELYLDSAGVFKDAIISIMATLAKQERIKISERTLAGLETARAKGKALGRPKKIFDRERLLRLRNEGWSLGRLSKEFRISRTHVARIVGSNPCPAG
jgi:DNA invertase Pin-like site-specific DNA recombinase